MKIRLLAAAIVAALLIALAQTATAADAPKIFTPAAATPAAPTYHLETRCGVFGCRQVWVLDQTTAPPVACTCAACPAGGACTSGQCGQPGCQQFGARASCGSRGGRFPRLRRFFGRFRRR